EELTKAAQKLRARGEKDGIRELKTGRFPLTDADGETLGLVASGIIGSPGYFRAPFQGGAMIVLLEERPKDEGVPLAVVHDEPGQRIREVFSRVVELLKPAEHRKALSAYARYHGFVEGAGAVGAAGAGAGASGAGASASGAGADAFCAARAKSGEVIVCGFG